MLPLPSFSSLERRTNSNKFRAALAFAGTAEEDVPRYYRTAGLWRAPRPRAARDPPSSSLRPSPTRTRPPLQFRPSLLALPLLPDGVADSVVADSVVAVADSVVAVADSAMDAAADSDSAADSAADADADGEDADANAAEDANASADDSANIFADVSLLLC